MKKIITILCVALIFQSCTNKDEYLRKEIIGSYSFAETDDSEDGVFITVNGTSIFKSNGVFESSGIMIMSIIDEYGDRNTLKYKIEMFAKYEIKNSYIIYDFSLENIGITLVQSDNRELSKIMQDHYIPQMKHEMLVNTKEKIFELTDKFLKTEEDVDGEKLTVTYIKLSEKQLKGIWKTQNSNFITNTSIAGVEVIGKTIREIKTLLDPALTCDEWGYVKNGETLFLEFHMNVEGLILGAVIHIPSLSTAEGIKVGSTAGDILKVYPYATVSFGDKDEYTHINGISYVYDWEMGMVGKYSEDDTQEDNESKILKKNVRIYKIAIYGDLCIE